MSTIKAGEGYIPVPTPVIEEVVEEKQESEEDADTLIIIYNGREYVFDMKTDLAFSCVFFKIKFFGQNLAF